MVNGYEDGVDEGEEQQRAVGKLDIQSHLKHPCRCLACRPPRERGSWARADQRAPEATCAGGRVPE